MLIAEDAYYREATVAKKQRHKRRQQKRCSSAAAYKKAAAIRSPKTASPKRTNPGSVETPTRVSVDETLLDDDYTEKKMDRRPEREQKLLLGSV